MGLRRRSPHGGILRRIDTYLEFLKIVKPADIDNAAPSAGIVSHERGIISSYRDSGQTATMIGHISLPQSWP